jgi:hypothetical protein
LLNTTQIFLFLMQWSRLANRLAGAIGGSGNVVPVLVPVLLPQELVRLVGGTLIVPHLQTEDC